MADSKALAASLRHQLEAHGVKVEPASAEELRALRHRAKEWAEGVRQGRKDA